jgi:NAD(P)-dependent dehydrogenase (short-subunit alcohol dehydrogenase family)
VAHASADLVDPAGPQRAIDTTVERSGQVDVLVANHAAVKTASCSVAADMPAGHWLVDARSGCCSPRTPRRRTGTTSRDSAIVSYLYCSTILLVH